MTASLETAQTPDLTPRSPFELPEDEIQRRTAEFLGGLAPTDGPYVGAVVTPDSPMFDAVCSVERQVFEQAFEGNDAAYMDAKYGPLRETSRFLVAIEKDQDRESSGRPVAFMRIVTPGPDAASTLSMDDAAEHINKTPQQIAEAHGIDDLSKCWDVATMGVLPEYQNTLASIDSRVILNRMFLRLASYEGIEHMVAIIDQKALDGLRIVGTPLVPMCDPEGSFRDDNSFPFDSSAKSYAVYGHIPSYWGGVARRYQELATAADDNPALAFLRRVVGNILVASQVDRQIDLPTAA